MTAFSFKLAVIVVIIGSAVSVTSLHVTRPAPDAGSDPMSFWEAAGRGLVTVTVVNETYNRSGHLVTLPVGIRVDNRASVPVNVSEPALLMSPHPLESPPPNPLRTTQDAVLTVHTIPAGGSLLYSYGEEVLQGFLAHPAWWCSEEFQFTQAEIRYRVGGETLPFALRPVVANEHYRGPNSNTQSDLWTYLRTHPTVVVGKEPLWTQIDGTKGDRIHVTIDATNLAVYSFDDAITTNVNVTHGVLEDVVPAGWSVEGGSYSVPPDQTVNHSDGSRSVRWFVDLPAALVSSSDDPRYPTPYASVIRSYVLISPALGAGPIDLPRARSDMDGDGVPDATSAAPRLDVVPIGGPHADAGGPYAGHEGETILLNASRSTDPDGNPLTFRWDFTGDGTFDTPWSSNPTAEARYTDEFSGVAVVEVSDGNHVATAQATVQIADSPPEIRRLNAIAQASFRIEMAGEKWHDLALTIRSDSGVLASLDLVRMPGNPAAQAATTGLLTMSLRDHVSATLVYKPADDRVNGRPAGDNPAWIVIVFPDGNEVRMHHNFNAQHPSTWTWNLPDLPSFFLHTGVTFHADLHEPGSDVLIVTWDFGDGTVVTQTFANTGIAPFDVAATIVHGYATNGPFTVTLTVRDDESIMVKATLVVPSV